PLGRIPCDSSVLPVQPSCCPSPERDSFRPGAAGGLGGTTVGAPAPSGSPPPRRSVRPHPLLQEIVARRAAPDKPRSPTRWAFSAQDGGGATTGRGSAPGPRPGRRAGGAGEPARSASEGSSRFGLVCKPRRCPTPAGLQTPPDLPGMATFCLVARSRG